MRKSAIAGALLAVAVGCESPADERAEIAAERAEQRIEQERASEAREEQREEQAEEAEEPGMPSEPMAGLGPEETRGTGTVDPCADDPNSAACLQQQQQHPGTPGTGTQNLPPAGTEPTPTQAQGATQQGTGQMAGAAQLIERETDEDISSTVARLNRELRANDFEVIATVRYDQASRERALREQQQAQAGQTGAAQQQGTEQQGMQQQGMQQQGMQQQASAEQQRMQQQQGAAQQPGMQQQGTTATQTAENELGDVRLILYRRANSENVLLDSQGIAALLESPRQIAVYERGEKVVIAYQQPSDMVAMAGETEGVGQLLDRITNEITQPSQQQATASQTRVRGERTAQADVQRRQRGMESELDVEHEANIGEYGTEYEEDEESPANVPTASRDLPRGSSNMPEAGAPTEG